MSGANLAILSGAVLGLLRLLRVDPRIAAAASAASVAGFVVLARPSPSVVRAAVMAAVVLLALALGRGRSALPALAAAVLVLLLVDPALAVDPGFVLSVLATAALVLLAPRWSAGLRRRGAPGWAAEALAVPAAAFLVTAPVVAGLNGAVSPIAVLANLLAVPAVAPATVLGVLAAVVSPIGEPLAQACAWAAGPAVGWLVLVADRTAAVPGTALPWPEGAVGAGSLAVVVLVLLVLGRSPRFRMILMAVLLGLALVLVPTRIVPPGWPPAGWAVVACDVGQGDALVLATGRAGWVVLVDAGPDEGLVDTCLRRLGVQGIALVVLSHLHADHVGGLAGALRGRPVAAVALGPVQEPRWALRDVARVAREAGAALLALPAGRRLQWPALVLDVLGPRHPDPRVDPEDGTAVNDGSLVLRASTPAGTVMFAGDAELAAQSDLVASGVDLRADVLKMPHHGSRYTSLDFLDSVRPRAVLVSVGAGNRYRHPDAALLGRLERAGATVRRTDTAGDVAVVAGAAGRRSELELVARGDPLPARRRHGQGPRARRRRRAATWFAGAATPGPGGSRASAAERSAVAPGAVRAGPRTVAHVERCGSAARGGGGSRRSACVSEYSFIRVVCMSPRAESAATGRPRAPAMTPEARREMILQAAVPLVIEYGAAVTTSQIARAAGIAEGTVFRGFADKDELLGACVAEAIRPDRTVAEIAAISLDQPLADRLTEAVAAMSAHLGRMGTLIGALHASGAGARRPPPAAGEHGCGPPDRRTATLPTRDAVAELFEPEREHLRLPPAQLASLFVALMFQLASCGDADEPSTADVVALFLHGALTGAGTTPSPAPAHGGERS